jgi:MarR family transcriptional regulator, organic hydroperoxide resistance regulator
MILSLFIVPPWCATYLTLSTIESVIHVLGYNDAVGSGKDACRAWQLLVKFFYAQREHLPPQSDELDLSPAQCHVLHLIEPGRPLPMRQLAETLSCDASNVTGLVDRLEARGLVERRPSAQDRRVKELQLTSAGLRLRSSLLRRMSAQSHPLSRLSSRQQRELVRMLEALLAQR